MNSAGSSRVSIPSSERKLVEDIKEIARNHSDEEIFAMLQECNMDPDETVQKLLFQDTFHEVKRKRDRRKENLVNREQNETWGRASMQGRGNRGARGGYYSRYSSHDAGGTNAAKDDETIQTAEKHAHVTPLETNSKPGVPESGSWTEVNYPLGGSVSSSRDPVPQMQRGGTSPAAEDNPIEENTEHIPENAVRGASAQFPSKTVVRATVNPLSDAHVYDGKKTYEVESKEPAEEFEKVSIMSRGQELNYKPSSNSSSRLQQVIGPQKVGSNMEWKPKLMNQSAPQVSATTVTHDVSHVTVETDSQVVPQENSQNSKESTPSLQKKLEELHFSESQHVIIPDHLQVPESQRSGLSFGSFGASFGLEMRSTSTNASTNEPSSVSLTGSSQAPSKDDGTTLSIQNASSSVHQENPVHSSKEDENLTQKEADVPLDGPTTSENEQLKQAALLAQDSSQISALHTPPLYSAFGLVPPALGGQFTPYEVSEAQTRESSAVANFIPFDPSTNYYAQIYQTGADGDGRFSPYPALANAKFNENTALSQPAPESASSPMLPSTGIAAATQGAGAAVTSNTMAQQPLPPYRQAAGIHMPQYPPNYMPYGHYFSPFYVPAPIHPFYSSTPFAQQPLPSSIYPPPPAAAVKYSQYKSGSGGGNPSLSTLQPSNGPYNSVQPGYNSLSSVNEDPSANQYKETNVYISGQQNEASTVWIPSPGRGDLPGIQTGSFYNLPHGQPVNPFGGLYHPTQSLAANTMHPILQPPLSVAGSGGSEMAAPPAGVYQPPQHAQMNWAGNY